MGRKGDSGRKPFRFILNESGATAANSYLILYPKEPLRKIAEQNPNIYRQIWEQLNMIEVDDLVNGGRTYGGGLHKLEPKELSNIPITADLHALALI